MITRSQISALMTTYDKYALTLSHTTIGSMCRVGIEDGDWICGFVDLSHTTIGSVRRVGVEDGDWICVAETVASVAHVEEGLVVVLTKFGQPGHNIVQVVLGGGGLIRPGVVNEPGLGQVILETRSFVVNIERWQLGVAWRTESSVGNHGI